MSVTSEMVAAGRITGRERLKMKLQSAAMKVVPRLKAASMKEAPTRLACSQRVVT